MRIRRAPVLAVLACVLAGCAGMPGGATRAWPARQAETLPDDARRSDWLWPLVMTERRGVLATTVLGPFAFLEDDGVSRATHVLWPLFTDRSGPGTRDVFLRPLLRSRSVEREDGEVDRDWALFPFLLGGSGPEGDSLLVFPFWGNTRGLLYREEMRFRLFPLYVDVRDGGYRSVHLLWPLVSWGSGDGRESLRVLPFLVRNRTEGKRTYTSVLWPLLHWSEEGLHTEHPVRSFFFFPFYGRRDSDVAWSRTYLFPLFNVSGGADGYHNVEAPWPVFRWARDPDGTEVLRVWPLFGRSRNEVRRSDFYLWPLVWSEDQPTRLGRLRSFRIVPVVRRRRVVDGDGLLREAEDQLWPLFRHERRADGSVRFRMLAPIPLPGFRNFRTAYGWIWTPLDHRRDLDGRSSTDLLWGLVQFRNGPRGGYAGIPLLLEGETRDGRTSVRLLKGLAGYEESEDGPALRLLWFVRLGL